MLRTQAQAAEVDREIMSSRVFSSDYELYGSLCEKVTSSLLSMVPTIETYSIDESFLNLGEFGERDVEPLARELRERVHRWGGGDDTHVRWYRPHKDTRQGRLDLLRLSTPTTWTCTKPIPKSATSATTARNS